MPDARLHTDAADAFVFVTPEYDYGPPAALVNALQYLVHEWSYKPAALVSYGGVAGGTRGAHKVLVCVSLPQGISFSA